jgi:hypothetical protein
MRLSVSLMEISIFPVEKDLFDKQSFLSDPFFGNLDPNPFSAEEAAHADFSQLLPTVPLASTDQLGAFQLPSQDRTLAILSCVLQYNKIQKYSIFLTSTGTFNRSSRVTMRIWRRSWKKASVHCLSMQ